MISRPRNDHALMEYSGLLLRRRPFHVIDDEHGNRTCLWIQLEAELFLDRRQRGRAEARGTWPRWPGCGCPFNFQIKPVGESGPIQYRASGQRAQAGDQLRHCRKSRLQSVLQGTNPAAWEWDGPAWVERTRP